MNLPRFAFCLIAVLSGTVPTLADETRGLIGHWPLQGDARDASGNGRDGTAHGVDFSAPGPNGKPNGAANFDGRKAFIEVPADKAPALGTKEFSLSGPDNWFLTGRLDHSPDVRYRRAWTMAVFQGRLFCGTLPSGRVLSLEAGKNVTHDRELPHGWQHLAVVKGADQLTLYVAGKPAATSSEFQATDYDLTVQRPLQIGFGRHDYFNGSLSNVRLYDRALTAAELAATP